MNASKNIREQAKIGRSADSTVVFSARMWADNRTDAEIRLGIKTLRAVLLGRQQQRATDRMESKNHSTGG